MKIEAQEQPSSAGITGEIAADIQKAARDTPEGGQESGIIIELETGEKLIDELSQKAVETSEKTQETSQTDHKDNTENKDTAAISEESAFYKLSPEALSNVDEMWGKEESEAAWQDMKNWMPSGLNSISKELDHLALIYKNLLLAILENTTAGVQSDQLSMLDSLLSDIMTRLVNSRMSELSGLFETFGSENSRTGLKAALYHSLTGTMLSEKELEVFFKGQREGDKLLKGTEMSSIRIPVHDSATQAEQGIIYQKAGEGKIKNDPQYAKRMRKETSISLVDRKTVRAQNGKESSAVQTSITPDERKTVYTPKDIEKAQGFASYMNREGNLLKLSALSGSGEELYGYLAALMAMKSQIFTGRANINCGLASELGEAVDRMIDYHIQEAYRQSEVKNERTGVTTYKFEPKAAYKIFYYMMNLYQNTKDISETANKGIRYAYQQFLKRREESRKKEDPTSFFTRERKNAVEDWKEGKQRIEQDYKEFMEYLGREDINAYLPEFMILSPWGMFVEPEKGTKESQVSPSPALFMGGAALFLVLILFVVFIGF